MEIQYQHRVPGRWRSTVESLVVQPLCVGNEGPICKAKRKEWIVFTLMIGTLVLAVFYGLVWHNKPATIARLTHKGNKPK